MSWLIPERKCWSASALTSRGVARKAGECSQVQVSDVVTGLPKRWEAEEAQRDEVRVRKFQPSPSIKSAKREALRSFECGKGPCSSSPMRAGGRGSAPGTAR